MSDYRKKFISGSIWSVIGQMIMLLTTLITNVILARILGPSEFGQIGVVMFFITLFTVFTEGGLGGALVRKNNASDLDYSTVFLTNLVLSIVLFGILILSSVWISKFYNDPNLAVLLSVSGVVLIINAFQFIQSTKLVSELKFKERTIYKILSIFLSSVIGITLAYRGFGIWSLVVIQILNSLFNTILMWIFEKYRIPMKFSKESLKELSEFGVNTTASSVITIIFDNIYQLILAKYFSFHQTGLYYQAKKIQDVPGGLINILSQGVIFSSLSKVQDNKIQFTNIFNKIASFFLVLLGLSTVLFYVYAEQIILLLYGKEWIEATFFMRLLSIASFFYFLEMVNRVIFKVYNKTKLIVKLELIKKGIQLIGIFIGVVTLDIKFMLIAFIISNAISYIINIVYSKKILEGDRGKELRLLFTISLIIFFTISLNYIIEKWLNLSLYKELFLMPLTVFIYLIQTFVFRVISKEEIKNVISNFRK